MVMKSNYRTEIFISQLFSRNSSEMKKKALFADPPRNNGGKIGLRSR